MRIRELWGGTLLATMATISQAGQWHLETGVEYRYLPQDNPYLSEEDAVSASLRAEYFTDWNDGRDLLEVEAFYRWSETDDERSHGDIQDLAWIHVADSWELRSGVRTVFWGVTEFQHLVDIINQEDQVERIDGEARLGQPMINLSLVNDWGILDLYALVGFRERTFPGPEGWPRGTFLISNDEARYESGAEDKRVDFAARWSRSIATWEIALSYFGGTSRDPELTRFNTQGELVPYYRVIDQVGLELQYNHDAWLWKLEALSRGGTRYGRYFATVFGFEYTYYGVFGQVWDLGVVSEYNFDERGGDGPADAYLENDIVLGLRLALNDAASSDLLVALIHDHRTEERVLTLEASRRLGAVWTINLEALFFHSEQPPTAVEVATGTFNPVYKLAQNSRNDLLQLELIRYF
ncbi:MAG: hypothetical protein SV765_01265 [Pseudomonadota bacterium]|nr:hypothetical protein [Pseudomonadota bacterium]